MRVNEVMSARPIVVSSGSRREAVRRLMESANVHHVPVIDDGRVVGVWLATREGPLILLGPEHVDQTFPEADAEEAMTSLIEDSEAVLVWDSGVPAGILTPSDLRNLVREALQHDMGHRSPSVDAPQAHWRSGPRRAANRLAGAQLILVEDRDGPVDPGVAAGEDLRIVVLDARDIATFEDWRLETASAVAICRGDEGDPSQIEGAVAAMRERRPDVPVFVLAPGHDDRGLRELAEWLEGEVRTRSGAPTTPRSAKTAGG